MYLVTQIFTIYEDKNAQSQVWQCPLFCYVLKVSQDHGIEIARSLLGKDYK